MCNQEKVTETENPAIRYRACEEWHTDPVLGRYCSYGILCEQLLSGDGWLQLQAVSYLESAEDTRCWEIH